jgi:hypothetical protein
MSDFVSDLGGFDAFCTFWQQRRTPFYAIYTLATPD